MSHINWRAAFAYAVAVLLLAGGLALADLKAGDKGPDFTIKAVDGKEFKLKPLVTKGKDQKAVVLIAFWGTWCPPCRAEAPHLQALYQKYNQQRLAMIGIAVGDTPKKVSDFARANSLAYTLAIDTDGDICAKYGVLARDGMVHGPQLFILDSSGTMRFHHVGYAIGSEKMVEKEIKQLLAEKPKP